MRNWVPPSQRPAMAREYRERLALQLAEAALLDLDTARRRVVQLGIDPIPERRSHVAS